MVIRALAWAPVRDGAVSPPAPESPRATSGSSADTRRISSAPPNAATAKTPTAPRFVFNRMLVLHRSAAGSSVGILPRCRPPQPSTPPDPRGLTDTEVAEQMRVEPDCDPRILPALERSRGPERAGEVSGWRRR